MIRVSAQDRIRELEAAATFARTLGMELLEADPELVRARLRWRPELCTLGGAMHGRALMALADNCGGRSLTRS